MLVNLSHVLNDTSDDQDGSTRKKIIENLISVDDLYFY